MQRCMAPKQQHTAVGWHTAASKAHSSRAQSLSPMHQRKPHLSSDSTHSSRMMQSSSQRVLASRAAATCSGLAPSS